MNGMLPVIPKAGTPVTADQVNALERSVAERVGGISDIETLQEWRAQAAALETYLRSKELQRPMLGAQRRVEARIGQLLGEAKIGRPSEKSRYAETFNDDQLGQFRILARAFDCLADDDWRKSRRALVSLIRFKLGLKPQAPPLPEGEYRCIVADPPWQLTTGPNVFNGTGESGNEPLDYETMSVEEIAALEVEKRAADDSHLYLWTTNRYIESAYEIARAWGFKPSVLLVWAKTPHGIGLGGAFRLTTEFIVYARRGSLQEKRIVDTTWFNWPRGRHSKKPDAFYELVESVAHAPYLDLFARQERAEWTVWGNEVDPVLELA